MFFQKELTFRVTISPEFFGPGLREEVEARLKRQVEGTCDGQHGFIIAVLSILQMSQGEILDFTGFSGMAAFDITYLAIVLKPFKGEVVDAIISSANKMGFFATVGPLQIFVSTHLIPADFKFESSMNAPCYISEDQTQKLGKDDCVRLKIVGVRMDAKDMFAIGTIKEDYLGSLG